MFWREKINIELLDLVPSARDAIFISTLLLEQSDITLILANIRALKNYIPNQIWLGIRWANPWYYMDKSQVERLNLQIQRAHIQNKKGAKERFDLQNKVYGHEDSVFIHTYEKELNRQKSFNMLRTYI